MNDQHTKVLHEGSGSKNRFRFAGSRKRSLAATSDVYRNSSAAKRRIVTSAAGREERVHHPSRTHSTKTREDEKNPALRLKRDEDKLVVGWEESTLAEELDIALDRNASEIFGKFHRELWLLVRSLPEVLHHASQIVDILLCFLLSPADCPGERSDPSMLLDNKHSNNRGRFTVNQATADILHLISVFARDLRHELHPFFHTKLLPRLLFDLVNPPLLPDTQPIPLDVTLVEAVFRCISYIFRYDAEALLAETFDDKSKPCLEGLRQYYGITLASKRELVRRLAAESYGPLIRKLKHDSAKQRHLRRVLRAFSLSCTNQKSTSDRLQTDAVDGISQLLFNTARGPPGRLHSKNGHLVIATVLDAIGTTSANEERAPLYVVVKAFFQQLCQFLNELECVAVIGDVVLRIQENDESTAIPDYLMLVQYMIAHRNGAFLRCAPSGNTLPLINQLEALIHKFLAKERFASSLPGPCQEAVVNLLFSTLLLVPEDSGFCSRIVKSSLRHVLTTSIESHRNVLLADLVVRDLIPLVAPEHFERIMATIGTAVLTAAADIVEKDPVTAINLVSALASVTSSNADALDDSDDVCFLDHAAACNLSDDETDTLLQACLVSVEEIGSSPLSNDTCAKLASISKGAAYLATVGGDTFDCRRSTKNYRRVSEWLVQLLSKVVGFESDVNGDMPLLISFTIQSISALSIVAIGFMKDTRSVIAILEKAKPLVEQHLLGHSNRLWALKCASTFVDALRLAGCAHISEDPYALFQCLTPNLKSCNHFGRLHTLKILSSLPNRPFVVDHSDLASTADLDDEFDGIPSKSPNTSEVGVSGMCSIMETLLSIEETPANLNTERKILFLVSRVAVLGRSGRLPIVYSEAAASHMLGLLFVKFSPIWPAAVKALVGLANGHEQSVWPGLHSQIAFHMHKYPSYEASRVPPGIDQSTLHIELTDKFSEYATWESSNGTGSTLFAKEIALADEKGRVSRHHFTDETAVFDSLWSVLAGAPQLITAHSRTIVPLFLRFMHEQYYVVHSDDPDSRELELSKNLKIIDDNYLETIPEQSLNGHHIHQRLKCMLKAFADLNGPHQLYKNEYLLSVFVSLVGAHEPEAAMMAFKCVGKFKLTYIHPYNEIVMSIFEKGKLRDAMMQLCSSSESGEMTPEHKKDLLPLLSRILFGRLASRAGKVKSSKDSPAARRNAVLSFLSSFCVSDDDIYPFLYFMMRVYVPDTLHLTAVEVQDSTTRLAILDSFKSFSTESLQKIPSKVHQGFLNVLEAVISQLGRKVVHFMPTFMSILVGLCDSYAVRNVNVRNDISLLEDDNEDVSHAHSPDDRNGVIRSLCYKRLAELFTDFSDTFDFGIYSSELWGSLKESLPLLHVMVLNSDKAPALLVLLRAISGQKSLIKMLKDDDDSIIPAVLKCLSDSSKPAVVETTLNFINNLLDDDDSDSISCGRKLLQQHLNLLLDQFRSRLSCSVITQRRGLTRTSRSKPANASSWRRELTTLCRVSEILMEGEQVLPFVEESALISLCDLLVPFLDHQNCLHETDKQKVLDILGKIVRSIPHGHAVTYYEYLSNLLGPFKAKAGFTSRALRKSLASVIQCVAETSYRPALDSTEVLLQLCSSNAKRVDEMDFDSVIPAISNLGDATLNSTSSWSSLVSHAGLGCEPKVLLPLVQTCFHYLYEEDGVISRGSFKALQALVAFVSSRTLQESEDSENEQKWTKLLEGFIVPNVRSGLSSRNESARKFFTLLLKDVLQCNMHSSSQSLFSDLRIVIRDDEPDLDFFYNITHVQIHRRARALQRLRIFLAENEAGRQCPSLNPHTLSCVLIPLATHPIYECKSKIEEGFALEGVATVGAIARHLPWSKYSAILWTHLTQFDRHPDREKYLIGLICAIIDAFHFDVTIQAAGTNSELDPTRSNSILRSLENRIIPKIESLLLKEGVEKKGSLLRSSVVLALHKLIHKLPVELFEAKFPRLVAVICNALRNRDSNARDIARTSLAKMVVEMDIAYLADVVRELATSLTEGFTLHVRNATLHTILLELSTIYSPSSDVCRTPSLSKFDKVVPALVDLIQQDIFGETQEKKDAVGVQTRYVKEAGGSKSAHSLELTASMIFFRPSSISTNGAAQLASSSIHVLVSPLLERLRSQGVSTVVTRRIRECLSRIVTGLLRNPTVTPEELIPFVRVTLESFVSKHEISSVTQSMNISPDSDDEETMREICVSGSKRMITNDSNEVDGQVAVWQPSTLRSFGTTKAAHEAKSADERAIAVVQDGANAPKLTGSRRKLLSETATAINDMSTISAVVFGLQLLSPTLKTKTESLSNKAMVDPFVPLLTTCVCRCRDTDVVLLSLRCLGWLLKADLPSLARCTKSLASKTLELLTSGSNNELVQATFKMLTLLITYDQNDDQCPNRSFISSTNAPQSDNVLANQKSLPLDAEQLQVLISFLREALTSLDQHNLTLALIKAIMTRRYVSAEFYDLMEVMLEQVARGPKSSLRDQCGSVFLFYIINYPLSNERIEEHLKQAVLNLTYEYSEGRLSSINLVTSLVTKLPQPVLQLHCQLFFLPLAMQLVNDDAQECRQAAATCIGKLLRRLPNDGLQLLYDFTYRWSSGDIALRRMSLQLFKIFVDFCPDFMKRGEAIEKLLETALVIMKEEGDTWETVYFSLVLVESMADCFNRQVVSSSQLWDTVIHLLTYNHIWVKLASIRLLTSHFQDPKHTDAAKEHLLSGSGSLYKIARNFCFLLAANETEQNDDLTSLVVKGLVWTIQAMTNDPHASFEDDSTMNQDADPVKWVMTRLAHSARAKGIKRRQAIFKCFSAFATLCGPIVYKHLELMLEPLHRVELETRNELEMPSLANSKPLNDVVNEDSQFAKDVMHLLEENCEPHEMYWKAYAAVTSRATAKKENRKAEAKLEAVVNPHNSAQRRIDKQDREKHRRKRRIDDRRNGRGATAKRKFTS